jgi:ribosome modulation factor
VSGGKWYSEGYSAGWDDAFLSGKREAKCPYTDDTLPRTEWERGYADGKRDHTNEEF